MFKFFRKEEKIMLKFIVTNITEDQVTNILKAYPDIVFEKVDDELTTEAIPLNDTGVMPEPIAVEQVELEISNEISEDEFIISKEDYDLLLDENKELKDKVLTYNKYDKLIDAAYDLVCEGNGELAKELADLREYKQRVKSLIE